MNVKLFNMRKQRLILASKIEVCKKDISKIRNNISAEAIKVNNFTADVEMFQNELKSHREREQKSRDELDKVKRKLGEISDERAKCLEAVFRQQIEDLLLQEQKTTLSTMSNISEPSQVALQ